MNLNEAIVKRFGLPTEIGKTVESNTTLDSILNRRSMREFSDTPIDGDLMNIDQMLTLFYLRLRTTVEGVKLAKILLIALKENLGSTV